MHMKKITTTTQRDDIGIILYSPENIVAAHLWVDGGNKYLPE